jgi:hypothetical protein
MRRSAIVVIAGICLLPLSLLAQSKTPAKVNASTKTRVPRAADGKPDLSGVWQGGSSVRGSWEEANSGLGLGGNGANPDAPGLRSSSERPAGEFAPYQPWAAQKVLEYYKRRGIDDPNALCLPPGPTRAATQGLFPIQFVQAPSQVVILYEYMNVFRTIPLNAKHPDDVTPTYMGDSVGHWEGDTLVVDVIGFNDRTWLQGTGTFHTEALHVTERFTRIDKDQINYEATLEDSNVFTRPWTIHSTIMLREGTRVREAVCAENNVDPARFEKYQKDGVTFSRP